tara:strand:- start:2945 stop:4234 length:1290 start_codon:yes stop_codon:yes gene_type:complete
MIRFFYCFLFFAFCLAQFGIQKENKIETVDGVAAVVENSVILKSDVMQQAYMVAQQSGLDPFKTPQAFEGVYLDVLDQMVNNLVLYEVSLKDTNIVIDALVVEESLKKELEKRISYAGSASALEKMFGEPLSMIRAKLRLEIKKALRIEKYTGSLYQSTTPSISDVKYFYETYKDSLPLLEDRVSFSIFEWPIKNNIDDENSSYKYLLNLKDSLALGFSFEDLAKRHSEDLGSASSGGSLGFFVRGSLFPEYESVAFNLNIGDVSDPFKTEVGYHLVLLEDRVGEKIKTSHILKKETLGVDAVDKSRFSFKKFLSEYNVYNSVEIFDSLCAHFSQTKNNFHGVYRNTPTSSLPAFLEKVSLDSLGYKPIFLEENSFFLVRVFDFQKEEKITLENYYQELFSLTQNQLMSSKINDLINKESKKLYIQKNY